MFPGMNPRDIKKAMKRMGIQQNEINATQVIIKTPTHYLVIDNPQVAEINMMGQKTYQVVGEARLQTPESGISPEDIATVAEQAQVSKEQAENALKETGGDLARAIIKLKG